MTFVIFGFWQYKDMTTPYSWSYANLALSNLALLVCFMLVVWNIYLSLSYRKQIDKVPTKYNFILGDDSFIPYQMPLRYIRKLLFCVFISIGIVELQVIGIIASNFMVLAFYAYFRPSKSKFSNYINILVELSYIGL
jgi:hypothetical protein